MNLSEGLFLVFLALVVPCAALAARLRGRIPPAFLAATGLLFYATWNPWYLLPLLATVTVDWAVALGLSRATRPWLRRGLLGASLTVDLGLLACFKYWDALAALWSRLPAGAAHPPAFRILFMTGISFYTFQSLGYVLDVYRGWHPAHRSWLRHLAFVAFFPTLLAGPITRAETLLPQFDRPGRVLDPELAAKGFFLIALGFAKKTLIADHLGDQLVNRVFEQPLFYSSLEVLTAIYAYAAQIYCDFSGYTDIALGAALLLGFELKDNFRFPYRAASLGEFWKRWHISFSTWLMDHVYGSLPTRRKVPALAYLNVVVTFLVGGLWHGLSWCFAIWGLIHGLALALERRLEPARRGPRVPVPVWRRTLRTVLTLHVVLLAWVFFRADSLETVAQMARRLADHTTGAGNIPWTVPALLAVVAVSQALPERTFTVLRDGFVRLPALAQAALLLGTGAWVRVAAGSRIAAFIYQGF